jgi:ankyrin repeat protein
MADRSSAMQDEWFQNEKLHFAADEGDLIKCTQLIGDGFDVNAFDDLGKTPLHYAAKNEHFDIVALLLSRGANVNAHHEPTIGDTPLGEIAGSCSLKMAKMLLDAGADPTIPGWMQLDAIYHAKDRKRGDGPQVYKLLRQYGARGSQ